jgi:hypothetical protein
MHEYSTSWIHMHRLRKGVQPYNSQLVTGIGCCPSQIRYAGHGCRVYRVSTDGRDQKMGLTGTAWPHKIVPQYAASNLCYYKEPRFGVTLPVGFENNSMLIGVSALEVLAPGYLGA